MADEHNLIQDVDHGWEKIKENLLDLASGGHVAVGVLGGGDRPDGVSNVMVATVQEYGSPYGSKSGEHSPDDPVSNMVPEKGIPERSFLRSTLDENADKYKKLARALYRDVMLGKKSKRAALNVFGLRVVADVKRKIQQGIDPELSDETIRRKKSSKPLIDKGQLINSITHEVRV